MQKQLLNRTIKFWDNTFTFKEWEKESSKDFMIFINDVKFTDKMLFDSIIKYIDDYKYIIEYFNEFCVFNDNIEFKTNSIDDILSFVNKLDIEDRVKVILFTIFLRCEIDNVNYSSWNGCKRIFMQIILILSKKFNLWIKIKNIEINKYTPIYIYNIWYNKEWISTSDFENLYTDFKDNYLPTLWN